MKNFNCYLLELDMLLVDIFMFRYRLFILCKFEKKIDIKCMLK